MQELFTPEGEPNIDRGMLSAKVDERDRMLKRLVAMSAGLRHAEEGQPAAAVDPSWSTHCVGEMEPVSVRRNAATSRTSDAVSRMGLRSACALPAWASSECPTAAAGDCA